MPRSENLTIMFTDIVGFTARTSRQSHKENASMLREHDRLLLPVVARYAGRRIKSIGDSLLCVFPSPTDAVKCGMAMHDTLWLCNRHKPAGEQMHIRVAINLGEVRIQGKDIFGEPVNIAARLEAITPADEVYFTESVYLVMNKAEVPGEPLGVREFKGILEPVRVYRVPAFQVSGLITGPLRRGPDPAELPYGGMHRGISASASFFRRVAYRSARARDRLFNRSEQAAQVVQRRLGKIPKWAAILALALVVVGMGGYYGWLYLRPSPLIEQALNIRRERWTQIEEYAKPIGPEDPYFPEALVLLGHVAFARGDAAAALGRYGEALGLRPDLRDHGRLIGNLVLALDAKAARETSAFFKKYPSSAAIGALEKRARRPGYDGRRWAVKTLEGLGEDGRIDRVELALRDFKEAPDCPQRRAALKVLRKAKEPRALPPVKEIAESRFYENIRRDNACLYDDAVAMVEEMEGKK